MLLENQVSIFYWALIDAKHFTLGHQIIMHLRLPIMSEVLLDHRVIQSDVHSSNPV